jgi:hypothetical protein
MRKPLQHTRQFALTGIALIFMSSPTTAQESFLCTSLWPSDELSGALRDMPCEQYLVTDEAYLALEGQHYVYFPSGWLDSAEKLTLVTRTIRAISFSLPYLNTLAQENGFRPVTRTNTILGVEDYVEGWTSAAEVHDVFDVIYTDACPVFVDAAVAITKTRVQHQQTIAHELFHCLQKANGYYADAPAMWWLEGSAEYYSNVIYCLANNEHEDSALYDNFLPPTRHLSLGLRYATVMFFQYLGNSKGSDWLLRQLFHLPDDDGFDRFAEELASWPGMAELFHGFAQSFTDDRIYDTDACLTPGARARAVMPRNPEFEPDPTPITVWGDEREVFEIDVEPFTFEPKRMFFSNAKEFEIEVDASHAAGISSVRRTESGSPWQAIPSRIRSPCEGEPLEYFLLATSTDTDGPADPDQFRLTLDITARDRDDCLPALLESIPVDCAAQGDVIILDDCLPGTWRMTEQARVESLHGGSPAADNIGTNLDHSGSVLLAFDSFGKFAKRFDATFDVTRYDGTIMNKVVGHVTTEYRGVVGGCVTSKRMPVGPNYLYVISELFDTVTVRTYGDRDRVHRVDRLDEGTPWNQWPRLGSGMGRYSCSADTLTIGSNRVYQRVR